MCVCVCVRMQNPATRSLASTLGWNVLFTVFPHPTLSSVSIISRVSVHTHTHTHVVHGPAPTRTL